MPGFLHEAPGIEARVRAVSQVLSHRLALVGGEDTPSVGGESDHVGEETGLQDLYVLVAKPAPAGDGDGTRGEGEKHHHPEQKAEVQPYRSRSFALLSISRFSQCEGGSSTIATEVLPNIFGYDVHWFGWFSVCTTYTWPLGIA